MGIAQYQLERSDSRYLIQIVKIDSPYPLVTFFNDLFYIDIE